MKKTFEYIRKVAEKYEFLNDFRREDFADYQYAKNHGWLERLTFLRKKNVVSGTYTYDVCRSIAKKCCTRSAFYKMNKTAYRYSIKNGWIEDFSWLRKVNTRKPRGYWTLERTRYALRVCSCHKELMTRFPGAKTAALRYGIYDLLHKKD